MSQFRLLSGTAAVLVGSALVYSYAWKAPQAPRLPHRRDSSPR